MKEISDLSLLSMNYHSFCANHKILIILSDFKTDDKKIMKGFIYLLERVLWNYIQDYLYLSFEEDEIKVLNINSDTPNYNLIKKYLDDKRVLVYNQLLKIRRELAKLRRECSLPQMQKVLINLKKCIKCAHGILHDRYKINKNSIDDGFIISHTISLYENPKKSHAGIPYSNPQLSKNMIFKEEYLEGYKIGFLFIMEKIDPDYSKNSEKYIKTTNIEFLDYPKESLKFTSKNCIFGFRNLDRLNFNSLEEVFGNDDIFCFNAVRDISSEDTIIALINYLNGIFVEKIARIKVNKENNRCDYYYAFYVKGKVLMAFDSYWIFFRLSENHYDHNEQYLTNAVKLVDELVEELVKKKDISIIKFETDEKSIDKILHRNKLQLNVKKLRDEKKDLLGYFYELEAAKYFIEKNKAKIIGIRERKNENSYETDLKLEINGNEKICLVQGSIHINKVKKLYNRIEEGEKVDYIVFFDEDPRKVKLDPNSFAARLGEEKIKKLHEKLDNGDIVEDINKELKELLNNIEMKKVAIIFLKRKNN